MTNELKNKPEELYLEQFKNELLSGKAKKCPKCNHVSLGNLPEVEIFCFFCWLIENKYIQKS